MTESMRQQRGQMAYHSGVAAENCIAKDYERRGFEVALKRWRGVAGEVDLIVRDGAALIFVEVKKARDFAVAAGSLSARQMQRLCRAAEEFLASEPMGNLTEVRFDVALVDCHGQTQIIENAFGQG